MGAGENPRAGSVAAGDDAQTHRRRAAGLTGERSEQPLITFDAQNRQSFAFRPTGRFFLMVCMRRNVDDSTLEFFRKVCL